MPSTHRTSHGLLAALLLSLSLLVSSCSKQEAASNASLQANEPAKAKPFEGQIFRTADDRQAITLVSQDELEMRGGDVGQDNLICKYTKQGDTLRVVQTMLGTTRAVYYKITPDGLEANDGTVLFNPAKFLSARGLVKRERGDFDGAIADFDRAIKLTPKAADAADLFTFRGIAKKFKDDFDGAIADFDRAIELAPKKDYNYSGRGDVKGQKGDFDGAIADYTRAIELVPEGRGAVMTFYGRGNFKSNKGDHDGAIADFDRAIELVPKDDGAYAIYVGHALSARGNAYFKKGDYVRAIDDSSSSIELVEKNIFAYHTRGWARLKRGHYYEAWGDVNKCRELGGNVNPEFLEELLTPVGKEKVILHHLRQLSAALDQYILENGSRATSDIRLEFLVGPRTYIRELTSIDGEDYRELELRPGVPWTIVTSSGITVTYPPVK